MLLTKRHLVLGFCLLALVASFPSAAQTLRLNGTTTLYPVVSDAAEYLRERTKVRARIDTIGGTSGGISGLAQGLVDVAMSERALSPIDRARYPGVDFREFEIGRDALAVVVSRDVWNGGVKSISRRELRDIYEGRITNWKSLGGDARLITVFNRERGRGPWEIFVSWLYGDEDVPDIRFQEVGSNQETRFRVGSTRGSLSQLSAAWADGQTVFALAIRPDEAEQTDAGPAGEPVEPSVARLADGSYPMAHPLFLVTNGPPSAHAKLLLDYLLSPSGQELVAKYGHQPLRDPKKLGAAATVVN